MPMYPMLQDHRPEILELCRTKMTEALGVPTGEPLQRGLIHLYDELLEVVRLTVDEDPASVREDFVTETVTVGAAADTPTRRTDWAIR